MIGRRGFISGLLTAATVVPAMAQTAKPPRIIMLGDSLTAGPGLGPTEGLVPALQAWLTAHDASAELIDHGLSGDTTYGGRIRLMWALRKHADAVVVQLGANDWLRRWSPQKAEANLDTMLKMAKAKGRPVLLVGIDARTGEPEFQDEWRAIWPRLAARHDVLLLPDLYAPLAAMTTEERAPYVLADGVHPSAKGAEVLAAHLGPLALELIGQIKAKD